MKLRLQGLAIALAISSLLGGCGGGSSPQASVTPASPPARGLYLLAGQTGGPGNLDGTGSDAHFGVLQGITVDQAGNLYVADAGNATVRQITPAGVVSTIAGKPGDFVNTDGDSQTARFAILSDISIDAAGNLYVTDGTTIRRVTQSGTVSTLAGSPTKFGYMDGNRSTALLESPFALASDATGNVYFSELLSRNIRKLGSNGEVSTFTGKIGGKCTTGIKGISCALQDGPAYQTLFSKPLGMALDSAGNLTVVDDWAVRRIDPAGTVTTIADLSSLMPYLPSVTVDNSGNTYLINDGHSNSILKINAKGEQSTFIASTPERPTAFTHLTVNSKGTLYATTRNGTIQSIAADGSISPLAGSAAVSSGDGKNPVTLSAMNASSILDAAGNLYVTQGLSIKKITPAGEVSTLAGKDGAMTHADGVGSEARFVFLRGIAIDASGNLYVTDDTVVRKITPTGNVSTIAGTPFTSADKDGIGLAASFNTMNGICMDARGNMYVSTRTAIRKITPDLQVSTLAGIATAFQTPTDDQAYIGSADGSANLARFNQPQGMAADAAGNIYVADRDNHTIRKITPAGVVSTLAGVAGQHGSADGVGSAARFNSPSGISIDSAGNLYVSDTDNHTVRQISPDGRVSTVAGKAGGMGVRLGNLPGSLAAPSAIAVGTNGLLYISSAGAVIKIQL
ncbi:hypothetical protein GTP23_18630 [Pseudoduganella sp. FT93W]|uniref:Teneurin NHL domain-containing protein n=1 Tax=Duganella fentianensis TaxID=2692177 RepID=A0A845I1P0_9BURK|nr:hypothetical protein [Duganella fentianensis]MYN47062.1 hypothetical protein [Duganella fentianensis]